jgi:hypothetical protein
VVRFSITPRKNDFFELFEKDARNLVEAAKLLAEVIENWEDVEQKIEQIKDFEHQGDIFTHTIISQLHSTFVTPLDREDIAQLANALDDVVDFTQATADAMLIYRVDRPTQRAKELAAIIVDAALEVEEAISHLRYRAHLNKILEHCVEINRLENEADRVLRSALAEMFQDSMDVLEIIKWREIYEHMESATDRCEDVADVLEGVVLKYA